MLRRDFIHYTSLALSGLFIGTQAFAQEVEGPFALPLLDYPTDALEPHIDKQTMEIHHGRHHKAYVNNLNKAIKGQPYEKWPLDEIFNKITQVPDAVRNNAGGHYNHTFFWSVMSPKGGGNAEGKLAEALIKKFGSFDNFKQAFAKTGTDRFGSGWVWLILDDKKELQLLSTANQDNPLMKGLGLKNGTPIIACDVWEHAYYLKYQNKRADYLAAFWNVVDWRLAEKRFVSQL